MRVYNFPSDEIHIKNNKGEELAKIGPDGVEIDGTSFPVVSVEDAGKTLVVNDEGKIVAGEAGSGNSVLVLAFASETTLNHTYAEVLAAYQNGIPIIFNMEEYTAVGTVAPQQNGSLFLAFTQIYYNKTESKAEFWQVEIMYNSDGTFTFNFKTYYWNVTASE